MLALKKFLEEASGDIISEVFSIFSCPLDTDIEIFLKEKAARFEQKSKSRTYLIFDTAAMEEGRLELIAYFSVAPQSLKIPESISNTRIKELDGLYTKRASEKISEIPAYLIGQLAKNDAYQDRIRGSEILELALAIVSKAQEAVGGRICYIECKNEKNIIDFYRNNGFEFLRNDPDDGLIQMYVVLE